MNNIPFVSKICSICHEQKPLSAFLQFGEGKESIYSNICINCRTAMQENKSAIEQEEGTHANSGLKIDAKAKIHLDVEKNLIHKSHEEENQEEKIKKEKIQLNKQENNLRTAKDEQKVRKDHNQQNTLIEKKGKPNPHQIFGGEAQRTEEQKIDFYGHFSDTQNPKEKYKGPEFEKLARLGIITPAAKKNMELKQNQLKNQINKKNAEFKAVKTWLGKDSATILRVENKESELKGPKKSR